MNRSTRRTLYRGLSTATFAATAALLTFSSGRLTGQQASANVIHAKPSNYRDAIRRLRPGDTLELEAGKYPGLPISGLNGKPDAWITIAGPPSPPEAIILGIPDHNTIEVVDSSYLAIENLRIDSRGIPGAFGLSARGHENNLVHHIRVENNTFVGQNGGQQTDGISTKTPTWGWTIRYNRIVGAGTGIYLGDSDGTQPFVAGVIENNLIQDTIGYDMEIKDQRSLPPVPGLPLGPTSTIIRNNVFIKNDHPSPDGDRPNVILGAFPQTDRGSVNLYEVYGNFFFHNHREALLQASGRVSIHDNVFVDGPYTYPAVVLTKQNFPLQVAYFYNNTIYTEGQGIHFGSRALVEDAVVGNLIFASTPISGPILQKAKNIVTSFENASQFVNSPSFALGSMDFFPLPGRCSGDAIDLSPFHTDADYALDFNGLLKARSKDSVIFRGAYADEGTNTGWALQAMIKSPAPPSKSELSLVWMEPAVARAGSTVPVTLFGSGFSTDAMPSIDAGGISVADIRVKSATEIGAKFAIPASAVGSNDVTVRILSDSSNPLRFRVTARRPAIETPR